MFNMHTVAKRYTDLINGVFVATLTTGEVTDEMASNGNKNLNFFNIESRIKPCRVPQTLFEGGTYHSA